MELRQWLLWEMMDVATRTKTSLRANRACDLPLPSFLLYQSPAMQRPKTLGYPSSAAPQVLVPVLAQAANATGARAILHLRRFAGVLPVRAYCSHPEHNHIHDFCNAVAGKETDLVWVNGVCEGRSCAVVAVLDETELRVLEDDMRQIDDVLGYLKFHPPVENVLGN